MLGEVLSSTACQWMEREATQVTRNAYPVNLRLFYIYTNSRWTQVDRMASQERNTEPQETERNGGEQSKIALM